MAEDEAYAREMKRRAERDARLARNAKYPVAAILRGNDWKAQNADALAAWNVWVEENGLPLAAYRVF